MPSWAPTLIFVPLVGFILYRRYKRTFGRQAVQPGRMWFRIVLLAILAVVTTALARTTIGFVAAGAGAALGIALGLLGLSHTTYETVGEGRFYTTKPWVGLAVTALFLGRLAARIFTIYTTPIAARPAGGDPFAAAQRGPLTVGVFLLLAAYYIVFYVGVLRKSQA